MLTGPTGGRPLPVGSWAMAGVAAKDRMRARNVPTRESVIAKWGSLGRVTILLSDVLAKRLTVRCSQTLQKRLPKDSLIRN